MARLSGSQKKFKRNFNEIKKIVAHVDACENGVWTKYEAFNDRLSIRENIVKLTREIMHWKVEFFW